VGVGVGDPVGNAVLGAYIVIICGRRVVTFCHTSVSNSVEGQGVLCGGSTTGVLLSMINLAGALYRKNGSVDRRAGCCREKKAEKRSKASENSTEQVPRLSE
jgi:hypothetical protein